jgi:hypothetical protein
VLGRTAPTTGIAPFAELVEQVMTTEPYASAARLFWIVDNGSSHQGPHAMLRMSRTWTTAQLVHLPIHASWLNQIEISPLVQRKVRFSHQDSPSRDGQERHLSRSAPRVGRASSASWGSLFRGPALEVPDDSLQAWPAASTAAFNGVRIPGEKTLVINRRISPTSTSSPRGYWPSRTATTPPPNPSTGGVSPLPRQSATTGKAQYVFVRTSTSWPCWYS